MNSSIAQAMVISHVSSADSRLGKLKWKTENLRCFCLRFCYCREEIPKSSVDFFKLQSVELDQCRPSVVTAAKHIREGLHPLQRSDPSPNTAPSTSLSLCSKLVVVVFAEAEVAAITVAEPVATAAERNRRRSRELFAVTFAAVSRVAVAPPSPSQQVTPDTITFAATVSSFHPRDLRTNNTDSKEIHHRGRRQFRDLLTL
nr:putative late blight resistance protein homolog R1A-10 [Ipomoea batatas]